MVQLGQVQGPNLKGPIHEFYDSWSWTHDEKFGWALIHPYATKKRAMTPDWLIDDNIIA